MGDKQRGPTRSNTGITGNGRRGMHSERRCVAVWPRVFPSHSLTHQVSGFSFWALLDASENSQASQTPTAHEMPGVRVQGRRRADGKYVESFGNHTDLVPGRLFQIDLPDGFAVRTRRTRHHSCNVTETLTHLLALLRANHMAKCLMRLWTAATACAWHCIGARKPRTPPCLTSSPTHQHQQCCMPRTSSSS